LELTNDFSIIDKVHGEFIINRDKVAALQYHARDAALAGSPSAKKLYKKAAEELCSMVMAIRDILNFQQHPYMVSYSGGLYKIGDLILPHFFAGIEALGGKPVTPKFEPLYGAVLLAFEHFYPEGLKGLLKRLEEM